MTDRPVDLQLSSQTKALMERVKKHAKHVSLKNSFRVIGMSYRKEVRKIFEQTQVRDPSLKWPHLSLGTEIAKYKAGFGDKPMMERTGKLKKSMTTLNADGNIAKFGHASAQFGSSVDYGVYPDNLDAPRHKLPLRNFSQPSESTYGSWLNTIDSDLTSQLKKAGVDVK